MQTSEFILHVCWPTGFLWRFSTHNWAFLNPSSLQFLQYSLQVSTSQSRTRVCFWKISSLLNMLFQTPHRQGDSLCVFLTNHKLHSIDSWKGLWTPNSKPHCLGNLTKRMTSSNDLSITI
jgi:hypothetical protein